MKRNRLKIRTWLTLTIGAASLAFASSASAMYPAADIGGSAPVTPPVVAGPSGFNWADAAIGAAVALAVVLAAIAVAHLARNRSRLVASH